MKLLEDEINVELKREMYLRTKQSAMGHIILASIFLLISRKYMINYILFLHLGLLCLALSGWRIYLVTKYLIDLKNKQLGFWVDFSTIGTGIVWGILFIYVYSSIGLFHPPTLSLFMIISGIAAGSASSLYANKKIALSFLFSVLIMPGISIIIIENDFDRKIIGLLPFAYYVFLFGQVGINFTNLKERLELSWILAAEARRIEELFNTVPGIFCYFQQGGEIVASNKNWREFSEKFESQDQVFNKENNELALKLNEFSQNINVEKVSFEFQFSKFNDCPIFVCHLQKINSTKGTILFMLDVTSLKNIQEEMKIKDAHLQHSARLIELGEMIGSIAHEINNPLTVLYGRAQVSKRMIKNGTVDLDKLNVNLNLIEMSAQRISKLVKGMKTLVRNSEVDALSLQSFESYLEIVNFLIRNKAEMRGVVFNIFTETKNLNSYCRPSQIEQVLINLLNNAIDAAESTQGRWVSLFISSDEKFLKFEVVDSGNGINEESLKKIWNPFFTTKEVGSGTGLGLSISLAIVTDNNGRLYYNSKNVNTSFVLEIPNAVKEAA